MTHVRAHRRIGSGVVVVVVALLAAILPSSSAPRAQALGTGATTGTIAVNGSGFGYGVGMSQYGAYGQAKANTARTGAKVAGYYYTCSTVAEYADTVPLRVNVAHAKTFITLRSTRPGTGGGGFSLQVTGLPDRWVPAAQYVTVGRKNAGLELVVQAVSNGLPISGGVVFGAKASILWSTCATTCATTLDVTTSSTKHYRWGSLAIVPLGLAFEGVLTLDLHSEYQWLSAARQDVGGESGEAEMVYLGVFRRSALSGLVAMTSTSRAQD